MSQKNIVVVGAGVSGLTTALLLSQRPEYSITVASKHQPGDYDIEYASPWAGANFTPMSERGTAEAEYEKNSWATFERLARGLPEAGVHFQRSEIHNRKKDISQATVPRFAELVSPNPWWRSLFPNFRELSKSQLKTDIGNATEFTSVCINTAIYLPWLMSQCLKNGVVFKRAIFKHIADAADPGVHHSGRPADLLLNCTGLSAAKLGGVEDECMAPIRGQIVVVRNEADTMYSNSGTDDGSDELMYIMTRAAGGGTVLGGCYQKGNWESQPDPSLAIRIMKRCVDMCPQLTGGKGIEHLDVIRHSVGLRPFREGGVRIEKEKINGVWVVHNYGHSGFGYQTSYGCSQAAAKLIDEALRERAKL